MRGKIRGFIATACIIFAAAASNAPAQDRVLSLREALEYSMEGNPGIRAASKGLLAQKEEVGIARGFLLPKVTFEERFMRTDNPTYAFMAKLNQGRFTSQDFDIPSLNDPSAINDFQTGFILEQPLFAPKAMIGINIARTEFDAKNEEVERKKEEVAFRVFKAFLAIQTAKAYVVAADKGIDNAREHLRIAEARYKANLGLYSDRLRAVAALSSAEERLVTGKKNLAVAKRSLGLMLGLAESVDVTDERPLFDLKPFEYYSGIMLSRKDLKSLETRYKNAENMLKMADASYYPTIGIGGSYQMNDHAKPFGSEGQSWQVAAFLRWEIFDGTKREHERRKAAAKVAETLEFLEGMKKEMSFNVYDAYLGIDEAKKGLELAKTALEAAEEGRRLVMARYESSLSPLVDLLDVQTSLDASRANVIAREEAYLTALANLGFQSGSILKDLGMEK